MAGKRYRAKDRKMAKMERTGLVEEKEENIEDILKAAGMTLEEDYIEDPGHARCRQINEPCLNIKGPDGRMVTIHHSFTVSELCHAAQTNSSVMMITGDEYNIRGMLKLIRKAIDLSRESVDISYVEGHCFMDYMKAHGALSPETAVDLAGAGLKNPNAMNTFIHSGKVGCTKGL